MASPSIQNTSPILPILSTKHPLTRHTNPRPQSQAYPSTKHLLANHQLTMPSTKDKLCDWIDEIPDEKLDGTYTCGRPAFIDQ